MSILFIQDEFTLKDGFHKVSTNVKIDGLPELLNGFIRCQIGKGEDNSKADELEVYRIRMEVDLTFDNYKTISDTGNKGLTLGILLDLLGKLENGSDKVEIIGR